MAKKFSKKEYKKIETQLSKLKQKKEKLEQQLQPEITKITDKKKHLTTIYKTISVLYSAKGDHTELILSLKEMANEIEKLKEDDN